MEKSGIMKQILLFDCIIAIISRQAGKVEQYHGVSRSRELENGYLDRLEGWSLCFGLLLKAHLLCLRSCSMGTCRQPASEYNFQVEGNELLALGSKVCQLLDQQDCRLWYPTFRLLRRVRRCIHHPKLWIFYLRCSSKFFFFLRKYFEFKVQGVDWNFVMPSMGLKDSC